MAGTVELPARASAFAAENPLAAGAGRGAEAAKRDAAAPAAAPPSLWSRATSDPTLPCRLLLSLTAVSLMWVASLSVAVALTDALVEQPSAGLVQASCEHAYDSARDARSDYETCVSRQMGECRGAYEAQRAVAVAATEAAARSNAAALAGFAAAQAACSAAVTTAVSALSEWQTLDTAHAVPYACALNDTDTCAAPCDVAAAAGASNCSAPCAAAADLVGDVGAVRSEAFATATGFADDASTTVGALAAYAAARAAYDEAYLANKTATLRADVAARIAALTRDLVALSNASFPDVFAGVDLASACLSGRSDANFSTPCFGGSLAVWKSTTGLGGPHQTSELSTSIKSKSIRLIFGRIDCSHRVLEAQPRIQERSVQLRAH